MDTNGAYRERTAAAAQSAAKSEPPVRTAAAGEAKQRDVAAEELKLLKRPRSKKYMKALKLMDALSENDERIIAEMKKEQGLSEDAEVSYTEDDMEAFRERVRDIVAEELRKEEEELRRLREAEEADNKRKAFLREIYANCWIKGCVVHAIQPNGAIKHHYATAEVNDFDDISRFAAKLVKQNKYDSAEVHEGYVVHRNSSGDVIKIYDISEIN